MKDYDNMTVEEKIDLVKSGERLDDLIYDLDQRVRQAIAEKGYALDELVNDPNDFVRYTVALKGFGLDKLANDKAGVVRAAVAGNGYNIDKLVNDPSALVRAEIASKGWCLDKLINDKDRYVRMFVAYQGYGLDKLINDPEEQVRNAAKVFLETEKISIEEYMEIYPENCVTVERQSASNDYKYLSGCGRDFEILKKELDEDILKYMDEAIAEWEEKGIPVDADGNLERNGLIISWYQGGCSIEALIGELQDDEPGVDDKIDVAKTEEANGYKYLSNCIDFEILKKELDEDTLKYMEDAITEWEEKGMPENEEDCLTGRGLVISWYLGELAVDTECLISELKNNKPSVDSKIAAVNSKGNDSEHNKSVVINKDYQSL